jgi:hypothetical protein
MIENVVAAVTEQLLLPLVVGGELRPIPPIGAKRAVEHARVAATLRDFSGESANEIQWQRLRVARRYCPIDRLPAPGYGEWLLAFALNDLLQATNPDLTSVWGRDRPQKLVELALEIVGRAGPPRTLGEALARHATFSRALELVRIDTHVSWWVGSRSFRGAHPPGRLLSWKSVRRVRTEREEVGVGAMAAEEPWAEGWRQALARWLAASPLTDLATATRQAPEFVWTGASLGLLVTHPGCTLARRSALGGAAAARVAEVLRRARQKLAEVEPRALPAVDHFLAELAPAPARATG